MILRHGDRLSPLNDANARPFVWSSRADGVVLRSYHSDGSPCRWFVAWDDLKDWRVVLPNETGRPLLRPNGMPVYVAKDGCIAPFELEPGGALN